jgi:hypothetical protein
MGDKIVAELVVARSDNKWKSIAQPRVESNAEALLYRTPSAERTVVLVRLLTRISLPRHGCQTFIHDSIP